MVLVVERCHGSHIAVPGQKSAFANQTMRNFIVGKHDKNLLGE